MRRWIPSLVVLVCALLKANGQTCSTTTYVGVGAVQLSLDLSYPGGPICGPGAYTNALPWNAVASGQAACPYQFNENKMAWDLNLTFTYESIEGDSGAGCFFWGGPAMFDSGVEDCSTGDVICKKAFVTLLGASLVQGFWLPGQTYELGFTSCWPSSASTLVTSCSGCTGNPGYACSSGTPKCMPNGWSGCTNGGTACPLPPPNLNCGAGFSLVCGVSGWTCQCIGSTCGVNCPLVLDLMNEGFHLTGWQDGVDFLFSPDSGPVRMGWTDPGHRNGFLGMDRNGNGMIDDGTELFGNVTPQPKSDEANGFAALAVFDGPAAGGNNNGFIDPGDRVFQDLRVWIDDNHDGVSQAEELKSLSEAGILRIGLMYHRSPFVDEHGNSFRYRGNAWMNRKGKPYAGIYDVFFVTRPNQ